MALQKVGMASSFVGCLACLSYFGCLRAEPVECDTTGSGSCHNGKCCIHPQHGGSLLQVGRLRNNDDIDAFYVKESDEAGEHRILKSDAGQRFATGRANDRANIRLEMSRATLARRGLVKAQASASQAKTQYEFASRAFMDLIYSTFGHRSSPMPVPLQSRKFVGDDETSDEREFNEAAERRNAQSSHETSIASGSLNDVGNQAMKMPHVTITSHGQAKTPFWSAFVAVQATHNRVASTLGSYMFSAMPTPVHNWRLFVGIADALVIMPMILVICIICSSLLVYRQLGNHFEVSQLPHLSWSTGSQCPKSGESSSPTTPIASPMLRRTMTNRPTGRRVSEGPYERLPSPSIIHTGRGSSKCLCPCLVVPNGNECFLAVPTLKSIGTSSNRPVNFDVKDMHGCTVLAMEVSDECWRHVGDDSQVKPAIVLRRANNKPGHSSEPPPLLACCNAGREVEGEKCMFIYDQQNAFFAYMKRDPSKSCYLLTSARMGLQLMFFGNFEEHAVSVVNEINEQKATLLATTEPAEMPFDTQKSFIKVRAGGGVDVGLILCVLTSIDLMDRN